MVLNVTTIDPSITARGAYRPVILIVLGSDAFIGCEAEVAGIVGLRSVAVVDNYAGIDYCLGNSRTCSVAALKERIRTAGCICNGLSLELILISKA